jgi:ankyrin repeat protein
MEMVQFLLDKGANPSSGLSSAAYLGDVNIVKLLLSKGAELGASLHFAASSGHADIVALLLAQPGVDVNQTDAYGNTPLHDALEFGHEDCAELIRAAGGLVHPNATNSKK